MDELARYPEVLALATTFAGQRQALVDLCIQVQQIEAPTDAEAARAAWIAGCWQEKELASHLTDVEVDEMTNVYARIPGRVAGPALMVSAHTDTVFPAGTDLTIRKDETTTRIYGPGLGDNSTGVASLMILAKTLAKLPAPPVDIWLVANTGEEGLGDLRGMRAAVDRLQPQLGACIVIEGMGLRRIVHRALGSRRFRISVTAPGGHSWSDFGTASAIHVLVQLAAELTQLAPTATPRTTFNIGRITGGTSINTIAQQATLELDLRSEDPAALDAIVTQVMTIVQRYQGATWQQKGVDVQIQTIGDRPAGSIDPNHPLVRASVRSLRRCGLAAKGDQSISSTDANIPLSRDLPAICIGITEGGNAHRLEEWINPTFLPTGMQHLLYTTWWAAAWLAGEVKG